MAIRTLLKFRNLDLTKDINDRFTRLFTPGVFDGGQVIPVVGQLKVDLIAPWKLINAEGMVVEETASNYRLNTPAGQITVIACKAVYYENNIPEIEILAIEKSAFDLYTDQYKYIIFALVDVPIGMTSLLSSYIIYSARNTIDKLGRNVIRGVIANSTILPAAKDNKAGDVYMVSDGIGGIPHLWGWDGFQWVILTDAATAMSLLATHRANLFANEKHATDNEKNALVGTSGTAPSATNKFVDNADTRVPTQSENDALQGSDGSPSNTNRYVTQEYPVAIPDEKELGSAPIGGYVEIISTEGPIYVGRGGSGSADIYFKFYDQFLNREYTTVTTHTVVNVAGVYLNSLLTSVIDPSIDPNVDSDGFFSGASLYIKYDLAPDSGLRLLYGKRQTLKTMPLDAFLRRNINDAQTSAEVVTVIENIKGRDFDSTVPTNEQNIELRKDIVDLKEYVSAVFKADHVVGDFSKVEGVPDFLSHFVPNVGIPQNYSYENTGLVGFTYSNTTATVTYISPVTLVGVVIPGHVFIDGAGNEYQITTVVSNTQLVIQKRNGITPLTINTTVTTSNSGACKPDNNPRKINLANLQYIIGRERISCRQIEIVPNEFHPTTNNIAFQIRTPLHSAYYREPRVRFYGGFQNRESGNRSRVVATSTGRILITGFYTDLRLLIDLKNASPSILVKIDGDTVGTTLDLSRANMVATLGYEDDIQQQSVEIATGLTDQKVHTTEIVIDNATDDFVIFGIDFIRSDVTTIEMLSGRAFVQSDLYKKDVITTFSPTVGSTRSRGSVATRYVNRSLTEATQLSLLNDFDGIAGGPAGTAVPGTPNFTVTSGLAKFQNYKAGDVIKIITAITEEVKHILSIGPGVGAIVFTTNITSTGSAIILHVASSTGESADTLQEYARYTTSDLGTRQFTDFSILFFTPSDRLFTVEDGTTSMAGNNIQYVTTGIDGVDTALEMIDGTSVLRIRGVASQLNLLTANSSSVTADFSIDGCPPYTVTIPSGGLTNIIGWANARYQTHELEISNATGMRLSGIILHEPTHATKIEGTLIATQNLVADYSSSLSTDGEIVPIGVVGVDPFSVGGVFVDGSGTGTGWASSISFIDNPWWGRYLITDQEGAYFEYFFLGGGIEVEYLAMNDRGKPRVFLNGILVTAVNFPTAVLKGVNISTGEIDMYDVSATPVRKKFGISGLSFSQYTLTLQIQTPRAKNVLSSAFIMNVGTVYEANSNNRISYTPSKGFRGKIGVDDFAYGMDWARDERNFDSGAVSKEEIPVFRTVTLDTRAQRVSLPLGATSITIAFSSDMGSTDYSLTCTISNMVDAITEYRPFTVTNLATNGFTLKWNNPIETGNYYLNYTATKFA